MSQNDSVLFPQTLSSYFLVLTWVACSSLVGRSLLPDADTADVSLMEKMIFSISNFGKLERISVQ